MVGALPSDLLGRHVVDRAHHDVAAGQLRTDEAGEPEVHQLHRPGLGHEDVARFDVAVNHAVAMRVLQPLADLAGYFQLAAQAHARRVRHPRRQILAREVLHGEVGLSVVLAEVMDRDDVLVRELAGGAGLAEEPFAALGVLFDGRRDHLDRDDPLQEGILGPIHHSHATLAELFEEVIAADCRHGTEGQAVGFTGSAGPGGLTKPG